VPEALADIPGMPTEIPGMPPRKYLECRWPDISALRHALWWAREGPFWVHSPAALPWDWPGGPDVFLRIGPSGWGQHLPTYL